MRQVARHSLLGLRDLRYISSSKMATFVTPDGKNTRIGDIVDVYKQFAKYPVATRTVVTSSAAGSWGVNVYSKIRNCDLMEIETYQQSFSITKVTEPSVSFNVQQVSAQFSDPNVLAQDTVGKSSVYLKQLKDKDGKIDKEAFAVSWYLNGILEKSIKLADLDAHGAVITNATFSSFSLSQDGCSLLYVAEKKWPKNKSFFEKVKQEDANKQVAVGNEYLYKEDWGEALQGIRSPVVCALDLQNEQVAVIQVPDMSLASPFWIANSNDKVGFIGFNEQPRRLGLIYCTNRESSLFEYNLKSGKPVCLIGGSEKLSLRSPRISPDGSKVILLGNSILGPHFKASDIILYDFNSNSRRTITDSKVYCGGFPVRCWSPDGSTVYFNCQSWGKSLLKMLNVTNGSLTVVSTPLPSSEILTIDQGLALVTSSNLTQLPCPVFVAEVPRNLVFSPSWTPVTAEYDNNDVTYSVETLPQGIQVFLVSPRKLSDVSGACIVSPHGGPHSAFIDSFIPNCHSFVALGFKVLLINFRGSTGMDEDSLNSLPGNVGTNDVADCISAVDHFVEKGLIDPNRLFLWGGSHGGFLVCHLAAQFPERNWVALGTRNPVVDIMSNWSVSDIPDWNCLEALGKDLEFGKDLDGESLKKMYEVSPIRWISKVKTPTLMLLGSEDLRVPMFQGLRWFDHLKALGVPTKCHVYKDKHSLDKVEVDSDVFVNLMSWFLHHLNNK